MLPKLQRMAVNMTMGDNHPWNGLEPVDILKSAGLYVENLETGKMCLNLAAIMLLGRDEVIFDVNPTYKTDALLRKVNIDRYDDRLTVQTNLIDSYYALQGFAAKHLLDKFFLEGDRRVSLAAIIAREMLTNTLIHREFSSHYIAKFVIMRDKMYVENACRARRDRDITLDNLEPEAKNPRIAGFFKAIHLVDELGSGTRRLFKYVPFYSNANPILHEGDVFRITVPLDDEYSFDARIGETAAQENDAATLPKGLSNGEKGLSNHETAQVTAQATSILGEASGEASAKQGEVSTKQGEVSTKQGEVKRNVRKLLLVLSEGELSTAELCEKLHIKKTETVRIHYLNNAIRLDFIELTQPNSPRSPTQKYRLTAKGQAYLEQLNAADNKL